MYGCVCVGKRGAVCSSDEEDGCVFLRCHIFSHSCV